MNPAVPKRWVPVMLLAGLGLLAASRAEAGETFLSLRADPYLLYPLSRQSWLFVPANSTFYANSSSSSVTISVSDSYLNYWGVEFSAPAGEPLVVGAYGGDTIYPWREFTQAHLRVSGEGYSFVDSAGDFQIKQLVRDDSGTIVSFWATFTAPVYQSEVLTGEVRYNAEVGVAVSAPLLTSIQMRQPLGFRVTATSAAAQPVALSVEGLPPGATFTDNLDGTGDFAWTPSRTQRGGYRVTFHGADGQGGSDSAVTFIGVTGITSLRLDGLLGSIVGTNELNFTPAEGFFGAWQNYGHGVSITYNGLDASELWFMDFAAPDFAPLTPGSYPGAERYPFESPGRPGLDLSGNGRGCNRVVGIFQVKQLEFGPYDTIRSFWATLQQGCDYADFPVDFADIRIDADVVVEVTAPLVRSVDSGSTLTFPVTASDDSGRHVALSAQVVPDGASFTDHGDNTGEFTWTPRFDQAGGHTTTFMGDNAEGGTDALPTFLFVRAVNHEPVAVIGGPYAAAPGETIQFDGRGSYDIDGQPLTYTWFFSDDYSTATGPTPIHTFLLEGHWSVYLTVSDGVLYNTQGTVADIVCRDADLIGFWSQFDTTCPRSRLGAGTNCPLRAGLTVYNSGAQASPATLVRFLLSADTIPDRSDALLAQARVGPLESGDFQDIRSVLTLRRGQRLAGKYILAVVDATNMLQECDESSNVLLQGPFPAGPTAKAPR